MDDVNEPSAALMAAMGGPAAREMMRNMMAAENGMGAAGGDGAALMDMANSWAVAAGGREGGTGGRSRGDGTRTRSRRNRSRRRNNAGIDNDDEEVQAVDANGQAMDEDDDYNYNYNGSDDDDDDSHDLGGDSNNNNEARGNGVNVHPPSLSNLFAQPTHLMHRGGGFMGAKNFAKDARRWLLVNIQSDNDFACHALNRDVWRNDLVENLVREGFILWQTMSHTNEGQTYITRYKVTGYPHLAIIDPRTGSLLWRKEGWAQVDPLTAEQFVEIASDFCSRHSFNKLPMAARHAYTSGVPLGAAVSESFSNGSGGRPAASANGNNKRPIHELTEEEQLQAAIQASMQEDADGDEDEDGRNVEADEKLSAAAEQATDNNVAAALSENNTTDDDESKPSAFEQEISSMDIGDEPTSGTDVARVQIRLPNGKRLVRKFGGSRPVKIIYAFVAQQNLDAAFELKAKFPPQDLFASVDDSISSCGLNGEAIHVILK